MTLFGLNLRVVCKDMNIEIETRSKYRLTGETALTLYEIRRPGYLLNLPEEYLERFNAWMYLPGEWQGYYEGFSRITIQEHELLVPRWGNKLPKKKVSDVLDFIHRYYPKGSNIFNIIYTTARVNRMQLEPFLSKFGTEW